MIICSAHLRKSIFGLSRIAGQAWVRFELAAASLNGFLGDVPGPDVHPPKFSAPGDLLAYLGMEEWEGREPEEQKAWLTWSEQEMSAAGFDVPSLVEAAEIPFDAALMDAMFANERLAIGILNTNFRRLDQSMRNVAVAVSNVFRQFSGQSDAPLCIAELGGGCGLLSMWLLLCRNGKQRRCRVYDYSRNNLAVGEAWARRLGLGDCLSFHLASYAEIASERWAHSAADCDFVFMDRAIFFEHHEGAWAGMNGSAEVGPTIQAQYEARYREALGAIRRLLKPNAAAMIATGPASPLALETFCTQIRGEGFFIDWEQFEVSGGPNLFVSCGGTHLFSTAGDDAMAIHSSDLDTRDDLDWREGEPLRQLLSKGQILAKWNYRDTKHKMYEWEVMLFQACGLFLSVQRSNYRDYQASFGSAAYLFAHARAIMTDISSGDYEIMTEEIAPEAQPFLKSLIKRVEAA